MFVSMYGVCGRSIACQLKPGLFQGLGLLWNVSGRILRCETLPVLGDWTFAIPSEALTNTVALSAWLEQPLGKCEKVFYQFLQNLSLIVGQKACCHRLPFPSSRQNWLARWSATCSINLACALTRAEGSSWRTNSLPLVPQLNVSQSINVCDALVLIMVVNC